MRNGQNESVLEFEHVSVRLDDVEALKGISFEMNPGDTRIIMGASGSGKTVLLKTAIGLLPQASGRVRLFEEEITNRAENELFALRSKVGVLFQEGGLFDSLTIEENVAYPLENQPRLQTDPAEVRQRVEEALRFVELERTLEKFPAELSGGMRRRVGIARAVVTEPNLVLYDSPTAGLDPITAYTIMALVIKERDLKNTASVIVTHRYQDGDFVATYRYDDREGRPVRTPGREDDPNTIFMVMRDGHLAFEGTLAEFRASSDPYVSHFVKRDY